MRDVRRQSWTASMSCLASFQTRGKIRETLFKGLIRATTSCTVIHLIKLVVSILIGLVFAYLSSFSVCRTSILVPIGNSISCRLASSLLLAFFCRNSLLGCFFLHRTIFCQLGVYNDIFKVARSVKARGSRFISVCTLMFKMRLLLLHCLIRCGRFCATGCGHS